MFRRLFDGGITLLIADECGQLLGLMTPGSETIEAKASL
jgi:hypothetical protein